MKNKATEMVKRTENRHTGQLLQLLLVALSQWHGCSRGAGAGDRCGSQSDSWLRLLPWQWLQAATASPAAGRSGGGVAQRRGVVRGEREEDRQFQTSQEQRDWRARGKFEKVAGNFESVRLDVG